MSYPLTLSSAADLFDRSLALVYAIGPNPFARGDNEAYEKYNRARRERYETEDAQYRFRMRVISIALLALTCAAAIYI